MQPIESRVRARVTEYTAALIVAVAASVFFIDIPLLPAPPVVPILVGLGLGALSLRSKGVSMAALYILVYFSILWQLIGFGFFQLLQGTIGIAVLLCMALPLLGYVNKKVELTSMALAVLAVGVMVTPAYFVSIPLIAAAATVSGFASLGALAGTFLFFLTPLLLLENALYFTSVAGATTPIVFAPLMDLSKNLRPPLPGLNVLLTGIPPNYLSPSARVVSGFLVHQSGIMIIPLVILGVILGVSSLAGGVTRSLLDRFAALHDMTIVRTAIVPIIISVVTPTIFIVLVTALSGHQAGGFQSAFTNDPTHLQAVFMIGSSIVLASSFTGREMLIVRFEATQVGQEGLVSLMNVCRDKMDQIKEEMKSVSRRVPSMNLDPEETTLSEYTAYLTDVEKQLGGASPLSLVQWQEHIETSLLPSLNEFPDRIRSRVVAEVRNLISSSATVNNNLAEAGVPLRYPDIQSPTSFMGTEELVSSYEAAASKIEETTLEISDLYASTLEAAGALMSTTDFTTPVRPTALLDSHDYVAAMRLVSEEYWLSFNLRWADDLEAKKTALFGKLTKLEQYLNEEERTSLDQIVAKMTDAKPADSIQLLDLLKSLQAFLDGAVSRQLAGVEMIRKMVESLDPSAARVLRFETLARSNEVLAVQKQVQSVATSFDGFLKFLDGIIPVFASQADARLRDRDNLLMLAHYVFAKKVIRDMLEGQKQLKLDKLPYQHQAALLYARLYAGSNPGWLFDDEGEELRAENA